MAPQVGWIGLGNMGRGMVKNLIQKGNLSNDILLYNRTTSRAEKLCQDLGHSRVETSVTELASKSDIIFICLGDDAAVLDTINAMVSSSADAVKDKLIVDCSTIHPDSTTRENDILTGAGAKFIACPVFGAPAMADSGQLVCVFAGPGDLIQRVESFGKGVMARENIVYADSPPSRATLLKIIGNTFILSMVTTLSEGHVLAEKSGLGTDQLHKFVETMFPGPYVAYSNRLLTGDYYKREEPLFAVDLARKDARHAKQVAQDAGVELKIVTLADEYLAGVKAEMGEKGDIASIYGAKRKESGLEFQNGGAK